MNVIVDIADLAATNEREVTLQTHSLGSCIAVALWDPETCIGGLLHFMLPEAAIAPEQAVVAPAMFCDTGVPLLFQRMFELGAVKRRLRVRVAGGGRLLHDSELYNIGKRNYLALRKLFWKNGVLIEGEDVGGAESRSAELCLSNGEFIVRTREREVRL